MSLPSALHLGFAKCGSTFLQAFWRHHPSVYMVFKANFFSPLTLSEFDANVGRYSEHFREAPAGSTIIESDEHLLMGLLHPTLGVRGLTLGYVEKACQRIHSVLPDVRLLLVVRNQLEMMVSTYSQYLLGGGTLCLDRFAAEFMGCSNRSEDYFNFYFDEIIEIIEQYFPGHLKVVLAEELAFDTDTQLAFICEFMQVPYVEFDASFRDRRVGLSRIGMPLVRQFNKLVVTRNTVRFNADMWLPRPMYKAICNFARVLEHYALHPWAASNRHQLASPELIEVMRNRFAVSNLRMGERIGKDLSRWSYSLPKSEGVAGGEVNAEVRSRSSAKMSSVAN